NLPPVALPVWAVPEVKGPAVTRADPFSQEARHARPVVLRTRGGHRRPRVRPRIVRPGRLRRSPADRHRLARGSRGGGAAPAGRVKHLSRFAPHPPARPSPAPGPPAPDVAVSEESTAANEPTAKLPVASPGPEARAEVIPTGPAPEAEIPPTPGWSTKPPNPKTARAVPGKGVVIIGQDGATVKFRMKCTTCGREDTSWKSISIPRGTARAAFFCSKCRKKRDVEIHGIH